MNKISYILISIILIGCSTAKPRIQTTKTSSTTYKNEVYKPKATNKTSTQTKTTNTQNTTSNSVPKSEELVATSKVKVTQEVVLNYISLYKQTAQDNMKNHGIPASITLAQGILESGAGTGHLAQTANNHFGIKCHKDWTGESVSHDDDAAGECFRKYQLAGESFRDHSLFLTSRSWYQPLFKLQKDDYKGWANGLKRSGYATDPKYPDKLIGIIERYQLHQYDLEVLGKTYIPTTSKTEEKTTLIQTSVGSENTHIVVQGETLYSISKKYNVTIDLLKEKNSLKDNAISIGQTLIIK